MKTNIQLQTEVRAELSWDPQVSDQDIHVSAEDGVVTLSGTVPTFADKWAAERAAERVFGVKAVTNGWITLEGDVDWRYQRDAAARAVRNLAGVRGVTNNIKISAKQVSAFDVSKSIKQALERRADRTAEHINVEAHGNIVTLKGSVPSFADRRAAEGAAWSAPGVTAVHDELAVTI
jgi:osmotically-inducible protein OsmY